MQLGADTADNSKKDYQKFYRNPKFFAMFAAFISVLIKLAVEYYVVTNYSVFLACIYNFQRHWFCWFGETFYCTISGACLLEKIFRSFSGVCCIVLYWDPYSA